MRWETGCCTMRRVGPVFATCLRNLARALAVGIGEATHGISTMTATLICTLQMASSQARTGRMYPASTGAMLWLLLWTRGAYQRPTKTHGMLAPSAYALTIRGVAISETTSTSITRMGALPRPQASWAWTAWRMDGRSL